jgi:hypothetical protein
MAKAAEPVRADVERREPRCRICRDPDVRTLVNELLDWRGVPIVRGRGKIHRITLTEILRDLEPLNEGRDNRDRITYNSLWIHSRRHYNLAGIAAYWRTRMQKEFKEFKKDLRGQRGVGRLSNSHEEAPIKYEEN